MSRFTLTRATTMRTSPHRVHDLIEDFRQWRSWSPWEEVDPDLRREYTGPDRGVGARYAWAGNSKAGVGHMEITGSTPERIDIDLVFEKPFKARNDTVFTLEPQGEMTRVSWTMTGDRNPVMALMGRLYFDKAIAKDFDRGLASLRFEAEKDQP